VSTLVLSDRQDKDRFGAWHGGLDEQVAMASIESGFKSGATHEVRASSLKSRLAE
jgi:hypothetical protein